jgi:hypothetical protein
MHTELSQRKQQPRITQQLLYGSTVVTAANAIRTPNDVRH